MLAPWKKSYDQARQHIQKQRHYFTDKGPLQAIVFLIVIHSCESWTIKKVENQRIDAFELWCWRRLLRILWTARRSYQSILKGISPEYSWEGLMLKLKLQYFGHLMWRADSFEKILMLRKIKGMRRRVDRGWDGWWYHRLDGHEFEQAPGVGDGREAWHILQSMGSQRVRHHWSELNVYICSVLLILSFSWKREKIWEYYFNFKYLFQFL